MLAIVLSQTYLQKSACISELLVELGKLKDMVSVSQMLASQRHCIAQQNAATNKSFIWSSEELLQFYCKNDTR